jgi:hypothetical protein
MPEASETTWGSFVSVRQSAPRLPRSHVTVSMTLLALKLVLSLHLQQKSGLAGLAITFKMHIDWLVPITNLLSAITTDGTS